MNQHANPFPIYGGILCKVVFGQHVFNKLLTLLIAKLLYMVSMR